MEYVLAMVLFSAACSADKTSRPICNAANQGRFWPEQANLNRDARRALYQSGQLELCVRGDWKYKWQPLSVNVHALPRAPRASKRIQEPQSQGASI